MTKYFFVYYAAIVIVFAVLIVESRKRLAKTAGRTEYCRHHMEPRRLFCGNGSVHRACRPSFVSWVCEL